MFKRRRYITFITALLTVSILLGAWIWSARNNQMLIADVQSDLEKAVQLQNSGQQSLNSQVGALLILQERLQQLDAFEKDRSVQFSPGALCGAEPEAKTSERIFKWHPSADTAALSAEYGNVFAAIKK